MSPRRCSIIPDHGKVEDQNVALGHGEIMHHGPVRDGDCDRALHLPVGPDHDVPNLGLHAQVVGHRMPLAGQRIEVRVGGEGAVEGAGEVLIADRLKLMGQRHGGRTGLHEGQRPSAEALDVGVHDIHIRAGLSGGVGGAEPVADKAAADEAIAVPLSLAGAQVDAVHHALSEEPVVVRRIRDFDGVRSISNEPPNETGGDLACHRQVERRHLFKNRTIGSDQIAIPDIS